jgi:hypothetical protein
VQVKKGFIFLLPLRIPDFRYKHLDPSQDIGIFFHIPDSHEEAQRSPRQNKLLRKIEEAGLHC